MRQIQAERQPQEKLISDGPGLEFDKITEEEDQSMKDDYFMV